MTLQLVRKNGTPTQESRIVDLLETHRWDGTRSWSVPQIASRLELDTRYLFRLLKGLCADGYVLRVQLEDAVVYRLGEKPNPFDEGAA